MNLRIPLKIFTISDLHLEFYTSAPQLFDKLLPRLPEADVCVLAGDIGYPIDRKGFNTKGVITHAQNYKNLLKLFKSKYEHTILVGGNHEYYVSSLGNRQVPFQALRSICDESGVHLLEKQKVKIRDVTFLGTTLWSCIDERTSKSMNDFTDAFGHQLDYVEEFVDSYRWLRNELNGTTEQTVVVTHHLPTKRLISDIYLDSPLNSAFYTNILDRLVMKNVKLWCCGHSHMPKQIKYGEAQIVLNPVGYPGEDKPDWNELVFLV